MTPYDADASDFVRWSSLLWSPLGVALADAARLEPGERVLDACCGTGASALPAARTVGPSGVVDAVDLTGQLLDVLRAEVSRSRLDQVRVVHGDVTDWQTERPYDAVLCGYGAFFFREQDQAGTQLVSQLRPGGRFVASVWQEGSMEFVGLVHDAVGMLRPEVTRPVHSDRWLDSPDVLSGWLGRIGLGAVEVHEMAHRVTLTPELAWAFVTGTGLRSLLSGLDDDAVERVRGRLVELVDAQHGWELVADSLIGHGHYVVG